MESNDVLTYEDLHSIITEVGKDMQAEMEVYKNTDPASELVAAGSLIMLKIFNVRLRQHFEKKQNAKREFNIVMNKVKK
jgi:hypothetical protein